MWWTVTRRFCRYCYMLSTRSGIKARRDSWKLKTCKQRLIVSLLLVWNTFMNTCVARSVAAAFGRQWHGMTRRPLMTQEQHWTKTAQTDHVILRPWPLTVEVTAPVADAGHRSPSVYQVWSLYAFPLPFGRYGGRCVSALMSLVTVTFDLLILKLVRKSHQRWRILAR